MTRLRILFAGLMIFTLAACASQPDPEFPELTFAHMPTITLGVAEIQVIDNFTPANNGTHVESRMPVAPETALAAWARDRLRANGVSGVATFVIEDASVIEVPLTRTEGLRGAFTKDQSYRYDARIRATVRLDGVPRVTQAFAEAATTRSQTVSEDITFNERQEIWFKLTEQLMQDFDPAMSASIRQHLSDFIRE